MVLHFAKGSAARVLALGASLVELAVAAFAAFVFVRKGPTAFDLNLNWIPSAGITFHLGMDGLSLCLVLLTAVLVPIILATAFRHEEYENPGAFYALVLFMQTGLLGVFTALDAFVFYFFWEVALIPIYFLAGAWGGSTVAFRLRLSSSSTPLSARCLCWPASCICTCRLARPPAR
ncbi:MAG: hypothetical protein WKG07_33040 [Hymenobacter sp.]